jgi:hypothetical protein
MKRFKKIFILMLALFAMTTGFTVAVQAGNTDTNHNHRYSRVTASGTNRSGTCSLSAI